MNTEAVLTRFWAKVNQTDGCWLWTGATGRRGYGLFTHAGRLRPAHRVIWELTHGPIPNGMFVCHSCDTPGCVRPDHLWLGTHRDNMADRAQKGRTASAGRHVSRVHPETLMRGDTHYARSTPERLARGEQHGRTTLTADQVRAIRAAYGTGPSYAALAAQYGVDRGTIFNIVHRKTWKHIP